MSVLKRIIKSVKGSGSVKAKARPRSSDVDVAKAVVNHSSSKAKIVKKKLDDKKRDLKNKKKQLEEVNKKIKTLKKTEESLGEKYKRMIQKKRSELVDDYRKVITKLKLYPMVDGFEVDKEKRILVKTKPIKILKKRWRKEKTAGVYQIRIDFSKENYGKGIQILNLTQRHKNEYDNPTIRDTKPCWGNIEVDIEAEFNSQDLYELVIDIIDYISSTNDKDGWLKWTKGTDEYKGGWEQFFSSAKKMPKNFCFEKYDQDNKGSKTELEDLIVSVTEAQESSFVVGATTEMARVRNERMSSSSYPMILFREAGRALRTMGLTRESVQHFNRMIVIEGGFLPRELELKLEEPRNIALYVLRIDRGTPDRFVLNEGDMTSDGLRLLRERGSYRFVFSSRSTVSPPPLPSISTVSLPPLPSISTSSSPQSISLGGGGSGTWTATPTEEINP